MPAVSIGIPTYQRPELLRNAIDSCLAQDLQDFEIVIVDDSPDTRTEQIICNSSERMRIRYVRSEYKQGQAAAKNQLLDLSEGDLFVLLHDDNILMPGALKDLAEPLQKDPDVVASFGKQYLLTHEGAVLGVESESLNERYHRTGDREYQVQPSEWAALVQQLPADGYMVRTSAARATRYRSDVGECCDAEFGWRLCKLGAFFLVGKYTSAERQNREGLTASGLRIHLSNLYPVLESLTVSKELEFLHRARLKQMAPAAVSGCLLRAARVEALRILLGHNYPWRQQFVRGVLKLGLVLFPRSLTSIFLHHEA
jgi:glycosyltransferase involved in cell wall biosynthesis